MRLRTKFNLALVLACVSGIIAATGLTYQAAKSSALQGIKNEIAIIHANALAVSKYTSTEVAPLLSDNSDILFLPHTVPSFSAQTVFSYFNSSFPDYYYKEAVLNPTNPGDLAEDWEADLINQLRADQSLDQISIIRKTDTGRVFAVAFPLTVTDQSCLECHSDPSLAPAAMIDLYGSENGFGWEIGETIGAQIIYTPIAQADKRVIDLVLVIMLVILAAFTVVILLVNLMLSRIVLKPVAVMSEISQQVSMGDFSAREYIKKGSDEISLLSTSFNRMRRSLDSAMRLLDD